MLPAPELSFRDCVLYEKTLQDSRAYQRALTYWTSRLESLPPGPALPLAKSPSAIETPRYVRRSAELEGDSWARLKKRSAVSRNGIMIVTRPDSKTSAFNVTTVVTTSRSVRRPSYRPVGAGAGTDCCSMKRRPHDLCNRRYSRARLLYVVNQLRLFRLDTQTILLVAR